MRDRLQKIISAHGAASRRAAEKMIIDGRVAVNGVTAELGQSADPEIDAITIDGEILRARERATYIMLNKPRGYVTTVSDEKGRKTVMDLVSDAGVRLYPVGRLDMDSEGLLIMTNDGDMANRLMHPSHNVLKTYHVWVEGENIEQSVVMLREPMEIEGYRLRPAKAELLKKTEASAVISVTIGQGRNRQVRKMCDKCSLSVKRLRRVSEGQLRLGDLPSGKWRYLSEEEIEYLQKL